ncbi:TolC family protein [Telmatobacter sp. DSM 110680]|uniref:TolC family protein n=1 Tax=Telmatobacter sp. DSM 110680 TaxID=3036704 RepID=A0AAU7DP91_9BACT
MDKAGKLSRPNFVRARFLGLVLLTLVDGIAATGQGALKLRDAIETALGKSPDAAIARAGNREADAGAVLSRTALLPQLSFIEDISRGNDPVYVFGSRLRQRQFTQADFAIDALNHPDPLGDFSTRLSGSWVAFDSFKTQREIRRADSLKQSAQLSGKAVDQQIVFRVVTAYQSVLFAQREVDVAEHEQETAAALLTSVDDHVKAGLAVESDRMSAQVNGAARKQELIAAQGDLELAWAQLREAMGVADLQASDLKPIEPHTFPQLPLEQEIETASKSRPDISALALARSAQASAVGAARSEFGPRISTYGNWEEDRGSLGASGGSNWVAGVQISIDILPLGKRAQVARETAAQQRIEAQFAASQLHVRLEVNQAHIHRQTAALSLETAQVAVDQATESLRIVRNRYGAGLATITDLLRAEDAERQSQSNYWHAVYGNTMAYAELLYATGTLTPDAAEELQ